MRIKTTPEEDKLMKVKAAKAASVRKYIVVSQSCLNVQKSAYEALVDNRIGFGSLYIDASLRNEWIPNTWIKLLPSTLQDLNIFLKRTGGNDIFLSPAKPKLTPVIIVLPLEDITPKNTK